MDKKPRKTETVEVRSKHKDFAPVGKTRFVTPAEAEMLYGINRAEPAATQPEYLHREMITQQRHHRKGK